MSILYLNGENLHHSFVSGAIEVIKNKKSLNDINVFPVADGDTGNNLASTMNSIIIDSKVMTSAKNTMNSIADAALIGARGNSGIIMAEYINGIFMSLSEEEEISISGFALSVKKAVAHAYNAISNPVEGTIITVIREWADAVYYHKDTAKDFYELLGQPLDLAFTSLKETTSKMSLLEKSQVVDSGAKGFVHFIEGFTEFIKTGKVSEDILYDMEEFEITESLNFDTTPPEHRFCTEALITKKNQDIDMAELKNELKEFGDSLIVAGNSNKARVHIHTNNPHKVLEALSVKGNILQQKADDMKRQFEAAHNRKYKIALVTDSIADIPRDLLDHYQINVVPLNLVIDNSSYLDNVTMTPEILYEMIDKLEEYPSSAQPSPKVVENLYTSLLNNYDEIIVITVAKVQSGTNNIFMKVANKLEREGKRIVVIDSKQNSGAEGLLVVRAAELIEEGKSFDEVVSQINNLRDMTKILVSVNTLKYMVRSGRLNKITGIAGKIINLKPVVSLDENGKGTIEEKAFSIKSSTKKIMNIVSNTNKNKKITRYAIVHANNPNRAEEYRQNLIEILGMEPKYIMNISTIVGMSAGVGSVAVAYMSEKGE